MWKVPPPSMAVNDNRCPTPENPTRILLSNTFNVWASLPPDEVMNNVISIVRGFGHVEYLIFNSHGSPGFLQMGVGFHINDLPLFAPLGQEGRIRGGIIINGCGIAHVPTQDELRDARRNREVPPADGDQFCRDLARFARCRVFAAETYQRDALATLPPPGMIDFFEGIYYEYPKDPPEHGSGRIIRTDPTGGIGYEMQQVGRMNDPQGGFPIDDFGGTEWSKQSLPPTIRY